MIRKLILLLSLLPSMLMAQTNVPNTAAIEWLNLIDSQQYSASWDNSGSLFRSQISKTDWVDAVSTARKSVGQLESRQLTSAKSMASLPNVPNGKYAVIQYQSVFSSTHATETITLSKSSSGWNVVGYYINLLDQ